MFSALAFQVALGGVSVYDVLWGAVFGFATLNILGLVARRFEPGRTRMTLGEFLAITVAVIAVLMLGWELLFTFHVLPVHLIPTEARALRYDFSRWQRRTIISI